MTMRTKVYVNGDYLKLPKDSERVAVAGLEQIANRVCERGVGKDCLDGTVLVEHRCSACMAVSVLDSWAKAQGQ